MLTRAEFESAIKDALRHYTRVDVLAANPLLSTRVAARGPAAASVQDLRVMLTEAANMLFSNGRDQKLLRVLDLTYFNPASKQEAAAERLGLPFSTYRRHLTASISRIAEWLWQKEQATTQADQTSREAANAVVPGQPNTRHRLSIVVLPFLNLSNDAKLDYLVDGIVDNLMTDLSRALPGSFVVSRSTAFTYKGRQVPVHEIGRQLRVRYVLEGSVLADADRVRVNAQLVDAETDEHLWAERFDKCREDVLQVQEEIVARLSRSVGIELLRNEGARSFRGVDHGDANDIVMRATALATDIRQPEIAAKAVSLFRQALALDPANVDAMVGVASTCIFQVVNQDRITERDALLSEAEALISGAFALAPDHIGVLKARAVLLRASGRFEEAVIATRAIIEINPGEPTAYREMGLNQLYLGKTEEAVAWFRRADSVAPRDPTRWTWLQALGRALMQLNQATEAASVLRIMMDSNPGWPRGKALLAASEALAGDIDRAERHMSEYLECDSGMTISRFSHERSPVPIESVSAIYQRENERILDGLRQAGMPGGDISAAPLKDSHKVTNPKSNFTS